MGFVRVIAQKLPEEQARKAKKRKQRKVSKNQNQITQDTLFCSGWIVVITTLGIEYSGEEILYLYRSRWQVERLFKRLKQNFSITTTSLQLFLWIDNVAQILENTTFSDSKGANFAIGYNI